MKQQLQVIQQEKKEMEKRNEIYESFFVGRQFILIPVFVFFPFVCLDRLFQHYQYENGVFFSKDSITIKNIQGTNTYSYSSIADLYGIKDFTKQDLDGYLTNKNVYSFYLSSIP